MFPLGKQDFGMEVKKVLVTMTELDSMGIRCTIRQAASLVSGTIGRDFERIFKSKDPAAAASLSYYGGGTDKSAKAGIFNNALAELVLAQKIDLLTVTKVMRECRVFPLHFDLACVFFLTTFGSLCACLYSYFAIHILLFIFCLHKAPGKFGPVFYHCASEKGKQLAKCSDPKCILVVEHQMQVCGNAVLVMGMVLVGMVLVMGMVLDGSILDGTVLVSTVLGGAVYLLSM